MSDVLLNVKGLRAGYAGNDDFFVDVSFSLDRGERIVVLGANGAGKTTMFLGLLGLIAARGEIYFDGMSIDVSNLKSVKKLRNACGLLFQNPDEQMFMPTVAMDVAFTPMQTGVDEDVAIADALSLLKELGIEHLADKSPKQLSLGEKRLVAIAGILAAKPQILLLDEPSSSLDPHASGEISRMLCSLSQSMLISTHNIDFALHTGHRAMILNNGQIVAFGLVEDIVSNDDLMRKNRLVARYCR